MLEHVLQFRNNLYLCTVGLKFSYMGNSKVVTFRCDEDLLQKVDLAVSKHRYYKRSRIIEDALRLAILMEERGLLGRVLTYHPRFDEVTKLEFEIKRKVTK